VKFGINAKKSLLGSEVEKMSDRNWPNPSSRFMCLPAFAGGQTPHCRALQGNNTSSGFMGDGINDAPACAPPTSHFVDNAVDIAKESAE